MSERFRLTGRGIGGWIFGMLGMGVVLSVLFVRGMIRERAHGFAPSIWYWIFMIAFAFFPLVFAIVYRSILAVQEVELTPTHLRLLSRGRTRWEISWKEIRGIEGVRWGSRWQGTAHMLTVHRATGRPRRIVVRSDMAGPMPERERFLAALAGRGFRVLDLGAAGE